MDFLLAIQDTLIKLRLSLCQSLLGFLALYLKISNAFLGVFLSLKQLLNPFIKVSALLAERINQRVLSGSAFNQRTDLVLFRLPLLAKRQKHRFDALLLFLDCAQSIACIFELGISRGQIRELLHDLSFLLLGDAKTRINTGQFSFFIGDSTLKLAATCREGVLCF